MFPRTPASSLPYPTDSASMMPVPPLNPQSPTVTAAWDVYNRIDTGLIEPYKYNANAIPPYAEDVGRATLDIATHTDLLSTEAQNSGNFNKVNIYRNQAQEARNFDSNLQSRQLRYVDAPLFDQFKQIHGKFGEAIADAENNFENTIAPEQPLRSSAAPAARAVVEKIKTVFLHANSNPYLPQADHIQHATNDIITQSHLLGQEAQIFNRPQHATAAHNSGLAASQLRADLNSKGYLDTDIFNRFQNIVQTFERTIFDAEGGYTTSGITNASAYPPQSTPSPQTSFYSSSPAQIASPSPYQIQQPSYLSPSSPAGSSVSPYPDYGQNVQSPAPSQWSQANTLSPTESQHDAFTHFHDLSGALPTLTSSMSPYSPSHTETGFAASQSNIQSPPYAQPLYVNTQVTPHTPTQTYHTPQQLRPSASFYSTHSDGNKPTTPVSPVFSPLSPRPTYSHSVAAYLSDPIRAQSKTDEILKTAEKFHDDVANFDSAKKKPDWKNDKFISILDAIASGSKTLAQIAENTGLPKLANQFHLHATSAETKKSTIKGIVGHWLTKDSTNIEKIRTHVNDFYNDAHDLRETLARPAEERIDTSIIEPVPNMPNVSHLRPATQKIIGNIHTLLEDMHREVTEALHGNHKDYTKKEKKAHMEQFFALTTQLNNTLTYGQKPKLKAVISAILEREKALKMAKDVTNDSKMGDILMMDKIKNILTSLQTSYVDAHKPDASGQHSNKDISAEEKDKIDIMLKDTDVIKKTDWKKVGMSSLPILLKIGIRAGMAASGAI